MTPGQRSHLRDLSLFKAPGGLTFAKHVRLHAEEKLRYFEEVASLPEDLRQMRLDRRYIDAMRRRWVTLYFGEIASAQYMGTAARSVPLAMHEFIMACVCQQIDELHHSEMGRDILVKIGLGPAEWTAIYEDTASKAVFDHLLVIEDPFEIAVKGGLFLESARAVVAFPALIRIAEAHGDHLTAANHRTRLTDEPRHMAFGVAMLRALVADDSANGPALASRQRQVARHEAGEIAEADLPTDPEHPARYRPAIAYADLKSFESYPVVLRRGGAITG